jgi:hypothetical protein
VGGYWWRRNPDRIPAARTMLRDPGTTTQSSHTAQVAHSAGGTKTKARSTTATGTAPTSAAFLGSVRGALATHWRGRGCGSAGRSAWRPDRRPRYRHGKARVSEGHRAWPMADGRRQVLDAGGAAGFLGLRGWPPRSSMIRRTSFILPGCGGGGLYLMIRSANVAVASSDLISPAKRTLNRLRSLCRGRWPGCKSVPGHRGS